MVTRSQGLARAMLRRMGETGQPPERGALTVNAGTQDYLELLREEYLKPIAQAHANSTFKLVQAPFGGGKTHFLHCLRETAWQEGFITSVVGLSPKSCPFDMLATIYQAVVRELEAAPTTAYAECDHGIGDVLRAELDKRVAEYGVDQVRNWLTTELSRARIDNHSFRRAAVRFLEALLDKNGDHEWLLESYLRGETMERSELQPFGVREMIDEKNAFSFLKSLIQLFNAMGVPGLVLMFDEIDRIMSLTMRKRRTIADNLREMIDCCGQSFLPGLVFVYAVPPEFLTNLVPEYPALEQRLRGAERFATISPLSPLIDLDHLSLGTQDLLREIGLKLLELHNEAYSKNLDAGIQHANIDLLAHEMAERQLETGIRRTFVKTVIQVLWAQKKKEKTLALEDIRTLLDHQSAPPSELEDEEIFG